jgi:ribA/ribD-fused uncharacterized protein
MSIAAFTGSHRFLSNFWPCRIEMDGMYYPSVEHAYQAAKTLDRKDRRIIQQQPKPGAAKRAGRRLTSLRPDWDDIKLGVMEQLVHYKFEHDPDLRTRLVSTYPEELVEGNTWGDRFWGVCDGTGENHLGRILMRVREELR